jgi:hypothetical protein
MRSWGLDLGAGERSIQALLNAYFEQFRTMIFNAREHWLKLAETIWDLRYWPQESEQGIQLGERL